MKLTVYVCRGCRACAEARRIAEEVREAFPGVVVAVSDLESGDTNSPVLVAPTYLLDGQLIYIGNPQRDDLWQRLRRHERQVVARETD